MNMTAAMFLVIPLSGRVQTLSCLALSRNQRSWTSPGRRILDAAFRPYQKHYCL